MVELSGRDPIKARYLKPGDVIATAARPKVLEVSPGEWHGAPAIFVTLDSTPNPHPFEPDQPFVLWCD
ncbi:hypothetical protein OG401_23970 [Kitasatospora purpeofusca]|uniref:hypothetical protein n=1 Tax=Kitasatospora purpeofusca TaxID=67352 RepID=UPI0022502A86|nr:hypothetical protein [Kitasatospora purpeofusca]MCX4687322.1 hypothetical protein [Kitasatospora purpeofusca]